MSTRPAVRDRRAPVATERLRAQLDAGRRLPALVLRAVDEPDGAFDDRGIELLDQLLARAILFDVRLQHGIEHVVRGDRVGVALVVAKLGARCALDRAAWDE